MSLASSASPVIKRASTFTYGPLDINEKTGTLACNYLLDDVAFTETIKVGAGLAWSGAAYEAARLVHLVSAVSYYKARAPEVINLGKTPVRPGERQWLRQFYIDGLGEFAYRNGLSLEGLQIMGGDDQDGPPAPYEPSRGPLIPFGGGIDSIVTVDITARARRDCALFIAGRNNDRFAAIERPAALTGLPVVRAQRELDPKILAPGQLGPVFNGHVPVTGVLSAIAVLGAVLEGRGAVVMSNEWSASSGNVMAGGRMVNHQFSKSLDFERSFRGVLARALSPRVDYFSLLRPLSELRIARHFATLEPYLGAVHSCNRAFHLDPAKRLDRWCGQCDKCCFIDLVLSPFLAADALEAIFDWAEPLADGALLPKFRALLGIGAGMKPFECVGDTSECRTAAAMAWSRPDRAGNPVLQALVDDIGGADGARADAQRLFGPLSQHFLPDDLAAVALA